MMLILWITINSFHFEKVAVPLSGLFGEHQMKREEIQ